jgi:hypothetical protein
MTDEFARNATATEVAPRTSPREHPVTGRPTTGPGTKRHRDLATRWRTRTTPSADSGGWLLRVVRRLRRVDPLTTIVVVATATFALAGIGSPLLGQSVFADTGSLASFSSYRDVLAGVTEQTQYQRDLVDDQMPNEILFGQALRSGEFAAWNPYALAGGALGSTPNLAVASPLSAPYWVLPGWLAPAYEKLLELIVAIGGMVLFLRRLKLSRAAAWLGSLVFASSAFMVVWTGWPQTRVAALIPALFWAVERLAQRARPREVALVSLPVAGMLLGGFPAVTGYAVLTAAVYLMVRLAGQHGTRWWTAWREITLKAVAAGAGLLAGVALVAWQLLPWVALMKTVFLYGRDQDPSKIIPLSSLITLIAPYGLGTVSPAHPPNWFGELQLIDAESYLGAAALVLVVASVALARTGRSLLPRGIWWALVGSTAVWLVAIYAGGPVLWLLQHSSFLFSGNFVGRARSVLGFLLATLAAVGFEALLRRRAGEGAPASLRILPFWPRLRTWLQGQTVMTKDATARAAIRYAAGVWGTVIGVGIPIYFGAHALAQHYNNSRPAGTPDVVGYLNRNVAVGVGIALLAGACAIWLWFYQRETRRHRLIRLGALTLIVALAAGQSLAWVWSYYPRTPVQNFYPTTPTQSFLAANLGHERYFGTNGAIYGSVDVTARLRSFHGHGLLELPYADLASTLPGLTWDIPATAILSPPSEYSATSPMLDRAAVDYYVTPPSVQPFGNVVSQPGNGPLLVLRPGQVINLPVPVTGPVRGIGVTPEPTGDTLNPAAHLELAIYDGAHHLVAENDRADSVDAGRAWVVPLAGENVARGTHLTATLTVVGPDPVTVATHNGAPALTVVTAADDGLQLVYAKETTIYHRTTALPRARWASETKVVPDAATRVGLIASGTLNGSTVVLDRAGPAADGLPAAINWVSDGLDQMELSVNAQGAGYLVLADAIQDGWRVTVDGVAASLVAADHAFVAVAVPKGAHTIRFYDPQPWAGPGIWISGATLLIIVALFTPLGRRWPVVPRLPLLSRWSRPRRDDDQATR